MFFLFFFFFFDKEVKLKRHDTRGLCKCNLSASEGHCRHIYSLCHEETYFCPACGITSYQRLSLVTKSFPQQCNKIASLYAIPCVIRGIFHCWIPLLMYFFVRNSELDVVGLGRLLSDCTAPKVPLKWLL